MATAAMSLIPGLIGGIAGLFGGGPQQKTQTSGTITNSGSSSNTNTSTPNFSPLQQALISQFTRGASDLYDQSADLSGYAGQGLKTINSGAQLSNNILRNTLASRGMSYSPAAGTALTQDELNRQNQGSSFLSSLPLLQRQLQSQSLNQLMQAFGAIPTGSTSTGNSQSNSTQTQQGMNLVSGNPTAGAIAGAGAGLLGPNQSGTGSNLGDLLNMFFPKGGRSQPVGSPTTGTFIP